MDSLSDAAGTAAPPSADQPLPAPAGAGRPFSLPETIQTILTAIALALIFRSFFVEPFIIPTGSMADGLLGEHYTLLCPHCGWTYDAGSASVTYEDEKTPTLSFRCPNCHQYADAAGVQRVRRAGDRILVHKWPFLCGLGPQRWQVVVFRDPADATQNYIKRLIGLPGEQIEILDGDIFINGRIARKPAAVQEALWTCVFDQDHLPVEVVDQRLPAPWVSDEPNDIRALPCWTGTDTRVVRYHGLDDVVRTLAFDPVHSSYYLQDYCGYNQFAPTAWVGDVRVRADVLFQNGYGGFRLELTRDADDAFAAELTPDGVAALYHTHLHDDQGEQVVGRTRLPQKALARKLAFEFGHLDQRAYLRLDGVDVLSTNDQDYTPDLDALRRKQRTQPVRLRFVALNAEFTLSHLRIDRDVHYLGTGRRATPGDPFQLATNEYFVLGDNSSNSNDARDWTRVDERLQGELDLGRYRLGTVRGDDIVGLTFLVYLPGLQPVDSWPSSRMLDLGRARWVR